MSSTTPDMDKNIWKHNSTATQKDGQTYYDVMVIYDLILLHWVPIIYTLTLIN